MNLRIYIAGPMTGMPGLNFAAFHAAAAELRQRGYEAVNPAEINPDPSLPWADCMRKDIAELVTCHAIQLLPGWQHSKGATLEHHLAERLELAIYLPGDQPPHLPGYAPKPAAPRRISVLALPAYEPGKARPEYVRPDGNRAICSKGLGC